MKPNINYKEIEKEKKSHFLYKLLDQQVCHVSSFSINM